MRPRPPGAEDRFPAHAATTDSAALAPCPAAALNARQLVAGLTAVIITALTPQASAELWVDALRNRNPGTTAERTRVKPVSSERAEHLSLRESSPDSAGSVDSSFLAKMLC
jgi:hypothetical protein